VKVGDLRVEVLNGGSEGRELKGRGMMLLEEVMILLLVVMVLCGKCMYKIIVGERGEVGGGSSCGRGDSSSR